MTFDDVITTGPVIINLSNSEEEINQILCPFFTFTYESFGSDDPALPMSVVMVSTVVIPRAVRAGVEDRGIQKDTQETMTISVDGM